MMRLQFMQTLHFVMRGRPVPLIVLSGSKVLAGADKWWDQENGVSRAQQNIDCLMTVRNGRGLSVFPRKQSLLRSAAGGGGTDAPVVLPQLKTATVQVQDGLSAKP